MTSEHGSIKGRVTDLTGKPVVGAAVFIVSDSPRHAKSTVLTDDNGYYQLQSLESAIYVVEVNAQGRKPVRTEVVVNAAHITTLNFVLPY